MGGIVIFTGANSSLGIHAADHILSNFPEHTVLFTVRDVSNSDENTQKLREVISKYPKAKSTIHELDLSSLSAVHQFAEVVTSACLKGEYPSIDAIVCNAYYWNLVGDPEITADGYDKTFQIAHISHAALILRLLGHFHPTGRVVLLSSDCHWPGKNMGEKYPPSIPSDLNLLVNPTVDDDKQGRGFQRYATAKLSMTTWMYALNRYLEKVSDFPSGMTFMLTPQRTKTSRISQL